MFQLVLTDKVCGGEYLQALIVEKFLEHLVHRELVWSFLMNGLSEQANLSDIFLVEKKTHTNSLSFGLVLQKTFLSVFVINTLIIKCLLFYST